MASVETKSKRYRVVAQPPCPVCGIPMVIRSTTAEIQYCYCPRPDCSGSRTQVRQEIYADGDKSL